MNFKRIIAGVSMSFVFYLSTMVGITAQAEASVPNTTVDFIDLGVDAHEKSTEELEAIVTEQLEKELNSERNKDVYYVINDVEFVNDTNKSTIQRDQLISVIPGFWAQRDNFTLANGSDFTYGAGIDEFSVEGTFSTSYTQSFTIANKFADSTPGLFATVRTVRYSYSAVDAETDEVIETKALYRMTVGSQSVRMVYCNSTSGLIYHYNSSGQKTFSIFPDGFNKNTGYIITVYAQRDDFHH